VLAAPVPHPTKAGMILQRAGCALEPGTLRQLADHNVRHLWIRHPAFDSLDDRLNYGVTAARVEVYHHVRDSFMGITARTPGAFSPQQCEEVVGRLFSELAVDARHAVWPDRPLEDPDELYGHCSNVAYLSLIVGMSLRFYIIAERKYVNPGEARDLTNLGVGAMLHDIGKLAWEGDLFHSHHFEEQQDLKTYRSHPERGYRALQGRVEATASAVILHHHQRFYGEGFPLPKSKHNERKVSPARGRSIHIFPRIVSVANTLDALIGLSHRSDRPTVAALAAIQSPTFRTMFDPVVLLTAMKCLPPFPIGDCVRLSDGREAVVVGVNEESPCQPKVQVVERGAAGEQSAGEALDLAAPGAPTIECEGDRPVARYLYRISPQLAQAAAEVEIQEPEAVGAGQSQA